MDSETADTILSLQLEDLAELGRAYADGTDVSSDQDAAIKLYRRELEQNAAMLQDHRVGEALGEAPEEIDINAMTVPSVTPQFEQLKANLSHPLEAGSELTTGLIQSHSSSSIHCSNENRSSEDEEPATLSGGIDERPENQVSLPNVIPQETEHQQKSEELQDEDDLKKIEEVQETEEGRETENQQDPVTVNSHVLSDTHISALVPAASFVEWLQPMLLIPLGLLAIMVVEYKLRADFVALGTCIACGNEFPLTDLVAASCRDTFCSECVNRLFRAALKMFPPSCCNNQPILLEDEKSP